MFDIKKILGMMMNPIETMEKLNAPITYTKPREVQIITTQEKARQDYENSLPDYVPEQYRQSITKAATEYKIPPRQLAAQLMTENREWDASKIKKDEGAQGLGQHRDIFYQDMNPKFKEKYGRDYDRLNADDNITATALGLRHYTDLAGGDMERGLASYNTGRANALGMENPADFAYNKTVRHFMDSSEEPKF